MAATTEFPGIALITGAGGNGIGAGIAHAFLRAGCSKLVLTDINHASLAQTAYSLKSIVSASQQYTTILTVPGDIADPAFIDHLFDEIKTKFGRLDYAVNCAGVMGNRKPSSESLIEEFDKIISVNYRGLFLCSRKELQMMKGQQIREREGYGGVRRQRGAIVNIASQLGLVAQSECAIYASTKSAVIGLTRGDALDHSADLIRVNAVCPGIISTNMSVITTPAIARGVDMTPMKRMGTVEEVADAVLFLCSERSSYMQGTALVVDGGYTTV